MTQKLTEEQQRSAHKIIKANRGDCSKGDNFLYCDECPWFRNSCSGNISNYLPLEKFQAENLRRSQAWLDAHITDAEIMAESPREFCERMVRTGMCKSSGDYCDSCVKCNMDYHETRAKVRAKAYLASHPATPQEPPKRRPTPEEMVVEPKTGMTQKLTEEQQRSAHKIIKANRGDCIKKYDCNENILGCLICPNSTYNSGNRCFSSEYTNEYKDPEFQTENLRRSQAWLDAHITDAEIMAETPKEFCERMVRTEGYGRCFAMIKTNHSLCKACVLSVNECPCNPYECLERSKAYLASHPATPQEPPKRRPTTEEMVVGATVRVRLWDELVKDGKLDWEGDIFFQKSSTFFFKEKQESCGTTHKIIKSGDFVILEGCKDWKYTAEMLDYVEPEKVVKPEPVANAPKPEAKEKSDTTVKGDVDKLPPGLRFINFRDLLPVDALRIIDLEGQVNDLTKKLAASKKLCERLQRRLRANWEAKHDGEMATEEEIEAWFDAGNGSASLAGEKSKIIPKGHSSWIPATRGNLKL